MRQIKAGDVLVDRQDCYCHYQIVLTDPDDWGRVKAVRVFIDLETHKVVSIDLNCRVYRDEKPNEGETRTWLVPEAQAESIEQVQEQVGQ